MNRPTAAFLLLLLTVVCNCNKLPSNVKKCDRNDKNFNKCLATATEEILKLLNNPISQLGLPGFNPLSVPDAVTFPPGGKHFTLEHTYWNLKFFGYTEAKILNFDIDFENKNISLECFFPKFVGDMNYRFNGDLYGEKVNHAEGEQIFTYTNMLHQYNASFDVFDKDKGGQSYMKVIGRDNIVTFEKVVVKVENEDKTLEDHLSKIFNSHYDTILEDIDYVYNKYWLMVFIHNFNQVLTIVPMSELFGSIA